MVAGHGTRAEAHLVEAAAALLAAGEATDWGHVLSVLAEVAMFCGDLERSRALHTEALARVLPPSLRYQVYSSIGGLAELAMVEGDFDRAERLAQECLALCRQRLSLAEIAWPLTCLGEIATRRGDFATAHAVLDEALRLGRYTDAYWRVAIVRADLGDLALAEGQPVQAMRLYRETLPVLLQRGVFAHPQGSLRLACLADAVGQHDVAATLLGACSAAVESGIEVLLPITQTDFDRVLAAARANLAADAFEPAWTTGRSLSPQYAVSWGLEAIHVSEPVQSP
jgi:tetratricopeptide (TPR) repeat protein